MGEGTVCRGDAEHASFQRHRVAELGGMGADDVGEGVTQLHLTDLGPDLESSQSVVDQLGDALLTTAGSATHALARSA